MLDRIKVPKKHDENFNISNHGKSGTIEKAMKRRVDITHSFKISENSYFECLKWYNPLRGKKLARYFIKNNCMPIIASKSKTLSVFILTRPRLAEACRHA